MSKNGIKRLIFLTNLSLVFAGLFLFAPQDSLALSLPNLFVRHSEVQPPNILASFHESITNSFQNFLKKFNLPTTELKSPAPAKSIPASISTSAPAFAPTPSFREPSFPPPTPPLIQRQETSDKRQETRIESNEEKPKSVAVPSPSSSLLSSLSSSWSSSLTSISNLLRVQTERTDALERMVSLSNKVDNLSNITLTKVVFSGSNSLNISDSDVPDTITASNYLPLTGGTITGALSMSGLLTVSSTGTSTNAGNLDIAGDLETDQIFTSGSGTSTFTGGIQSPLISITSTNSTSTFANGIQLSGGCFRLPDGSCAGSGGGTINSGTANRLAYYSGATSLDSANFLGVDSTNSRLGIGTTTPGSLFSIAGSGTNATSLLLSGVNMIFASSSTTTIPNNAVNAWSIATSTSIIPMLSLDTSNSRIGFLTNNPQTRFDIAGQFNITNSGNVGIGTTTPNWAFQIASTSGLALSSPNAGANLKHWTLSSQGGNLYFATSSDTYSTSTISALTITANGLLGVGTTSPSAPLSIAGHCVIGDTRLRRRRRKSGVRTQNSKPQFKIENLGEDDEYIYDEVRIKDIESGDEVLSLNEAIGSLEWRPVLALWDMGIKPVYKLTTKSGKTITTTGNHAYLARKSRNPDKKHLSLFERGLVNTLENPFHSESPVEHAEWIKVYGLAVGDEIMVSEVFETTKNTALVSDAFADFNEVFGPRLGIDSIIANRHKLSMVAVDNSLEKPVERFAPSKSRIPSLGSHYVTGLTVIYQNDNQKSILWDPISSIEFLGNERVYDITVEGTHNFIGNDIVAHNTYLTGGLGVGRATTTSGNFEISGSALFGDAQADVVNFNSGLLAFANRSTTTILNSQTYSYTIATSTSAADPILFINTAGGKATTSIVGGFSVESGAIEHDWSSGITSINNLNVGATAFDSDAGQVIWADLPVTESSATGTIHSYLAQIDGNPILSLHSVTDATGLGTIGSTGYVGIGTSTPNSRLTVYGTTTIQTFVNDTNAFRIMNAASSTIFVVDSSNTRLGIGTSTPNWSIQTVATKPFFTMSDTSAGANLKHWTLSSQGGNLYFATSSDTFSTSSIPALMIDSNARVGIGTSSPMTRLAVAGNIALLGCLQSATTSAGAEFNACLDLAETYPTSDELAPGDIVAVDPKHPGHIKRALFEVELQTPVPVIGIVSSNPNIIMEGQSTFFGGSNYFPNSIYYPDSQAPVALAGRVPVKVNLENGNIKPGDRISLSSVPGIGRKSKPGENTVGIALESYPSDSNDSNLHSNDSNNYGKILVFVNLGYSRLDVSSDSNNSSGIGILESPSNVWSVDQSSGKVNVNFFGDLNLNQNSIFNVSKIISGNGKWRIDEEGNLTVKEIQTNKLKVGTPENPQGITIYDLDTKEPYCAAVKQGEWIKEKGGCDDAKKQEPKTD